MSDHTEGAAAPPPAVLNTPDAARYVGMSAAWLKWKRGVGGGPAYCRIGSRILYRVADLDAYLLAHRREVA